MYCFTKTYNWFTEYFFCFLNLKDICHMANGNVPFCSDADHGNDDDDDDVVAVAVVIIVMTKLDYRIALW